MKKVLIWIGLAVGVVLLAGILWCGMAWCIGSFFAFLFGLTSFTRYIAFGSTVLALMLATVFVVAVGVFAIVYTFRKKDV
jgi:hypothetical protein